MHIEHYWEQNKKKMSLQDYTKRCRVAKDMFESHISGPLNITKVVEAMQGYNETDSKSKGKYRNEAYQRFTAFLHLSNADGTILTGLHAQQSLNIDQYPRIIANANNG
jgi:hypothetical protein